MKIALSTDHTGFEHLKSIKTYLTHLGHECIDYGPNAYNKDDDYPDFMRPAAEAVARGEADVGIILGGSGQGEAMTANHVPGVRCAVYYGPAAPLAETEAEGTAAEDQYDILRLTRRHNHANMLSLAVRFVSPDELQKAITIWLETAYSLEKRHARRAAKIDQG